MYIAVSNYLLFLLLLTWLRRRWRRRRRRVYLLYSVVYTFNGRHSKIYYAKKYAKVSGEFPLLNGIFFNLAWSLEVQQTKWKRRKCWKCSNTFRTLQGNEQFSKIVYTQRTNREKTTSWIFEHQGHVERILIIYNQSANFLKELWLAPWTHAHTHTFRCC